jgi:ABC-2 type transport system ATP-binding protein
VTTAGAVVADPRTVPPTGSPSAPAVVVDGLTKAYGDRRAVDDLSFTVAPGRITGFLGPNGAGKTTTLRMLLGLAEPTAGRALVFGRRFVELERPSRVGALIDASGFHPGRRARDELAVHAVASAVDLARVDEVLAEVGLEAAAGKRIAELSLGMRQRLGLASALLGEPELLVLDEPANGLDPAGMHWLRDLLRRRAAAGTAVLVSSHILTELALFADDVVVLHHGRLVTQSDIDDLVASGTRRVFVASPDPRLPSVVEALGGAVVGVDGGFEVTGADAVAIGDAAACHGVALHQLRTEIQSLEDVFLGLTAEDQEIR